MYIQVFLWELWFFKDIKQLLRRKIKVRNILVIWFFFFSLIILSHLEAPRKVFWGPLWALARWLRTTSSKGQFTYSDRKELQFLFLHTMLCLQNTWKTKRKSKDNLLPVVLWQESYNSWHSTLLFHRNNSSIWFWNDILSKWFFTILGWTITLNVMVILVQLCCLNIYLQCHPL